MPVARTDDRAELRITKGPEVEISGPASGTRAIVEVGKTTTHLETIYSRKALRIDRLRRDSVRKYECNRGGYYCADLTDTHSITSILLASLPERVGRVRQSACWFGGMCRGAFLPR